MAFQAPVTVLQATTKRDTGKKAQFGNIMAGKVRGMGRGSDSSAAPRCLPPPRRERRSNAGGGSAPAAAGGAHRRRCLLS